MKRVFISYKREEKDKAISLSNALKAKRLKPWLDEQIPAGEKWDGEISKSLLKSGAVVTLWSKQSVASEWVMGEAAVAKVLNKLVPVRIDDCEIPDSMTVLQEIDLRGWDGKKDNSEFRKLVRSIKQKIRWNLYMRWRWVAIAIVAVVFVFGQHFWFSSKLEDAQHRHNVVQGQLISEFVNLDIGFSSNGRSAHSQVFCKDNHELVEPACYETRWGNGGSANLVTVDSLIDSQNKLLTCQSKPARNGPDAIVAVAICRPK